jgi:hypothetical protein
MDFPDRNKVVNLSLRLRGVRFPVPGLYEFQMLVDGDLIAQRKLRVYQMPGGGP